MKKQKGQNRKKEILIRICGTLFWIGVWYAAAAIANTKLLLPIPFPHETVVCFWENLGNPEFWKATFTSLFHIICGFTGAAVLGVVFGVLSGCSGVFRAFSAPLKHVIRSVPVAAFAVIAWLWIPSDILPGIIAGIMVLPVVWSHTDAGLLSLDTRYTETAKVFGMGPAETVFRVKLPLILPQIRTGCITSIGIAWKAGVAAEVISNPKGSIGALLQGAKMSVEYEQVFAVTLMIVLLSMLLEEVLKLVWREQKR